MDGVVVLAHYNYTSLESQNLAFLLSLSLAILLLKPVCWTESCAGKCG